MENHSNNQCRHEAVILWTARHALGLHCPSFVHLSYGFVRFSFPLPNFQNSSVLLRDSGTFPAKQILAKKTQFCAFATRACTYDK
jgi:hypothetical protein